MNHDKDKKICFKSKCINGRIIGLECERMVVASILCYISHKYKLSHSPGSRIWENIIVY